jgi:hypothetical protein
MHHLLLTALLVFGLGATAAMPVAAGDPAATQTSSVQHQQARPHRPAQPFLVVGLVASQARCKWTDAGSHAWTG